MVIELGTGVYNKFVDLALVPLAAFLLGWVLSLICNIYKIND